MAKRTAVIGIPDPTFTYEEFKRELGGKGLKEINFWCSPVTNNNSCAGDHCTFDHPHSETCTPGLRKGQLRKRPPPDRIHLQKAEEEKAGDENNGFRRRKSFLFLFLFFGM